MAAQTEEKSLVTGRVRAGSRAVRGILIEAFHVPDGFQERLPIEDREKVQDHALRRLGSAVSDAAGEFSIRYDNQVPGRRSAKSRANLWVLASACRASGCDTEIVFQSRVVRARAGDVEEYLICLDDEYEDLNNPPVAAVAPPAPATLKTEFKRQRELEETEREIAQESFQRRQNLRESFQSEIAPTIRATLSNVEHDANGKALDPDYVETEASVRTHAESRMLAAVNENLAAHLPQAEKLTLNGRISLTPSQMKRLEAAAESADTESFTVDEHALSTALEEDGSGENPENGQQIVNRVDAVVQYCRRRTKAEDCLRDEGAETSDESGGTEEGDASSPIDEPRQPDRSDQGGNGVTAASLQAAFPQYIARVLDERSVLDSDSGGLPTPGSQLTEDSIRSRASFPSLTLPPGPADIPAFYDFHDLQIAFRPVWQEALDESVIGDAEAIYEHYVENGGDPTRFVQGVFHVGTLERDWLTPSPPGNVQKHIEITNEQWSALSRTQQLDLKRLASDIADILDYLHRDRLQGNVFTDGVTSSDLTTFNNTRSYVLARVGELRDQGERLVRVARAELQRRAQRKSILPASDVLRQLRQRAASAYPAKYFAANRRQRSVNFGVLLTYRQHWTPTAYQVGELIKSIPLAPKEVRKYSKKIVTKERRARKEIESNLESMKSETNATTRAEAEIVQRATEKTNFNASANGSFTVGVWSGGGSSALTQDVEANSAETKKSFHEAVVKSAREYRNELKVELETESTFEEEFQESGEIVNPNDELPVTFLFYELQRRYRVHERLHRLTSVVLVAQEMPNPGDIDEDWLITHRWVLNRVLLDDSFKQPLFYVAEGLVAEQYALEEARASLAQQRALVEELKEDISETRIVTESRYSALQRSMERTARAAQREEKGGGLFGFVKKLVSPPVIGGFVDQFIDGTAGESTEAARVREAAAQDAYQREVQRLRDLEAQLSQTNASLARATEDYTNRLSVHLANVVRVTELKNHVKDNITHYMQAIWMHEPFQQRWLRLKDVPVPVLKRPGTTNRKYQINRKALAGSLANVAHLRTAVHDYTTFPEVAVPDGDAGEPLDTVPLYEVADIDDLLGFRANYMIFPLRKANAITDFMMDAYTEKAAGAFGLTDPDDFGNMTLDEFADYVCCLKEDLEPEEFDSIADTLRAQLKKLLQSPLRDDEEIVVPMDSAYIEALPGATPILEDFKLLHRQIDAADAQEDLRLKRLEKLRYAQRLLSGEMDDPEAEARYVFEGMENVTVSPSTGDGQGEPEEDDDL